MGEYKLIIEKASQKDVKDYEESKLDPFREFVEGGVKYTLTGDISILDNANKTVPTIIGDIRINLLVEKAKQLINQRGLAIGKLEITVKEDDGLLAQRAREYKLAIKQYRKKNKQ